MIVATAPKHCSLMLKEQGHFKKFSKSNCIQFKLLLTTVIEKFNMDLYFRSLSLVFYRNSGPGKDGVGEECLLSPCGNHKSLSRSMWWHLCWQSLLVSPWQHCYRDHYQGFVSFSFGARRTQIFDHKMAYLFFGGVNGMERRYINYLQINKQEETRHELMTQLPPWVGVEIRYSHSFCRQWSGETRWRELASSVLTLSGLD